LAAYFKEILADYDEERVYPSDIKKILNWYNMIQAKGLVVDEVVAEENVAAETPAEVAAEVVAEKPKKEKKIVE
jgi:hypothetical protein